MTLADLVPTLEVCQQLKAAGFPQDTAMVWVEMKGEYQRGADGYTEQELPPYVDVVSAGSQYHGTLHCAAPTAGELEEWLSVNNLRRFITAYYEPYEPIERRWSVASDLAKKPEPNLSTCHAETLVAALAAIVLEVAG